MKISELKSGQGKVDMVVDVKSKAEVRTFNKYGKDLKVCNATVSDGSGDIVLSLWNDDIEKINQGDKVRVSNGYVSEFNGEKQLTSGKFGALEVVKGADGGSPNTGSSENASTVKKSLKVEKKSTKEMKKVEEENDEKDSEEDFEDKEF